MNEIANKFTSGFAELWHQALLPWSVSSVSLTRQPTAVVVYITYGGAFSGGEMVFDIVVALIITAIAVVLGITVHPVLLFIIVLAIVYLVARHRSRA